MPQKEIFPKGRCSVFIDEMKGHNIADFYSQPVVHPSLIGQQNKEMLAGTEALQAAKLRQDLTLGMVQKADNTREEQVKQLLLERGINLDTPAAFVRVLKTRCSIGRLHNQINFYLDGQLITSWYDTVETKFTIDEKGEYKITSIFGAPPGRAFEDE